MLTRKIANLIIGLFLVTASFNIMAKAVQVAVKLMKIEAVKTSENHGDQLYFSISEYSNKTEPQLTRKPMFPLHWLSKDLPHHKAVILWQGSINTDESVLLILSLIEQDLSPLNPDDHIGSAQLKLINKGGKISANWGQPQFKDQPKVEQPNPKVPNFMMFGDSSQYKVQFKLETN